MRSSNEIPEGDGDVSDRDLDGDVDGREDSGNEAEITLRDYLANPSTIRPLMLEMELNGESYTDSLHPLNMGSFYWDLNEDEQQEYLRQALEALKDEGFAELFAVMKSALCDKDDKVIEDSDEILLLAITVSYRTILKKELIAASNVEGQGFSERQRQQRAANENERKRLVAFKALYGHLKGESKEALGKLEPKIFSVGADGRDPKDEHRAAFVDYNAEESDYSDLEPEEVTTLPEPLESPDVIMQGMQFRALEKSPDIHAKLPVLHLNPFDPTFWNTLSLQQQRYCFLQAMQNLGGLIVETGDVLYDRTYKEMYGIFYNERTGELAESNPSILLSATEVIYRVILRKTLYAIARRAMTFSSAMETALGENEEAGAAALKKLEDNDRSTMIIQGLFTKPGDRQSTRDAANPMWLVEQARQKTTSSVVRNNAFHENKVQDAAAASDDHLAVRVFRQSSGGEGEEKALLLETPLPEHLKDAETILSAIRNERLYLRNNDPLRALNREDKQQLHPFNQSEWDKLEIQHKQKCLKKAIEALDAYIDGEYNDQFGSQQALEQSEMYRLHALMQSTFIDAEDKNKITSSNSKELFSAVQVIYRGIRKTELNEKVRKGGSLTDEEIAAYNHNQEQGAVAAANLCYTDKGQVFRGVLCAIFGALLIAAAILAAIPTCGGSFVASGPLAAAGMYLMLAGLGLTPLIVGAEVKGSKIQKFKKAVPFVGLPVTNVGLMAINQVSFGAEATLDVIKAGGSAVGLKAGASGLAVGVVASTFLFSFLDGAALLFLGIHRLCTATKNRELSTFGCGMFSDKVKRENNQKPAAKSRRMDDGDPEDSEKDVLAGSSLPGSPVRQMPGRRYSLSSSVGSGKGVNVPEDDNSFKGAPLSSSPTVPFRRSSSS